MSVLAEKVVIPDLFTDTAAGPGSPPRNNDTRGQEAVDTPAKPRLGSRADRLMQPQLRQVARAWAQLKGVCERPTAFRQTDTATGRTVVVDVPCDARLASKCKACAERNRRDRQRQIREGWHLAEEPMPAVEIPAVEVKAAVALRAEFMVAREECLRDSQWDQVKELDLAIDEVDEQLRGMRVRGSLPHPADESKARRRRSTRRRRNLAELPRVPMSASTLGRVYRTAQGKLYRPSMLITTTLPGYGPVHTVPRTRRGALKPCDCGALHGQQDPLLGTPQDPDTYDYRRQALDAIHFAAVTDRFIQNLRRAAGFDIQYAGVVEMQKRMAPHLHMAIRGTLPRKLIEQVAAATDHGVWWPHFDQMVYTVDKPPVWDEDSRSYADPKTGQPLKTWDRALDEVGEDPDATPAHVIRLGRPDGREIKGVTPGTKDADRAIRYMTKYVTKDLAEQAPVHGEAQIAHRDRLRAELEVLPCSPTCANWLLYGVQPNNAKQGLVAGRCKGKVHQPHTLGFAGRRVLISRKWSGKTLTDQRADQRDWMRQLLDEPERTTAEGMPRFVYERAHPDDPDVPNPLLRVMALAERRSRYKTAIRQARGLEPPPQVSATPDQQPN